MAEPVFVAREAELNRLQTFLYQARLGQAQVCFVIGDAGAGKSALLAEFARRAEADDEKVIMALGECNAQTGLGDPFLPFREILAQMTGDTDAKAAGGKITAQNAERLGKFLRISTRTLIEVAPDIIGTLIPGGRLIATAAKVGAEKAGWLEKLEKKAIASSERLDQSVIFQQIANWLAALATEQTLLLMLDDLQWADQASIALLFHLSRTLKESRVLIVGAFRPTDVALGRDGARHPLEATLNEIKRYRGDVRIDLNETTETDRQAFMEALIDSEPNRLNAEFRAALFAHAGGYPLFTVELLRNLQERGDLVWDETGMCWTQPGTIDWDDLPARVEGVIEERVGRLAENLRDILTTASVEGMQFTTQVVARIREVAEHDLLKSLSDKLERRHHLVQEGGEEKVGKVRLWHYQFGHVLFQKYLYDELSRGERRLLHSEVARILAELYGDRADTIAVQLALHYDEAGEDESAAHYYGRAGEQAAAVYGNDEALRHFTRALELTAEDDAVARYDHYGAREAIYNLQGAREAQRGDLDMLERLAEALDDDQRRAQVALRRAAYSTTIADFPTALIAAKQAITWALALDIGTLEAEGHARLGAIYNLQRSFAEAQTELEQSLALAQKLNLPRVEADSLNRLGNVQFKKEKYDLAQTYYEDALRIARNLGDRMRENTVLGNLATARGALSDAAGAETYTLEALRIARAIGDRISECNWLGNLGFYARDRRDYTKAQRYYEEGLQLSRLTEDRLIEIACVAGLGWLLFLQGDYAGAEAYAEQELRLARSQSLRFEEGNALTVAGLIGQAQGQYEKAREQALNALAIAEASADQGSEQFAAGVMANALMGLGRLDEAADFYRRALAIQRDQNASGAIAETLAGLARVAQARGDIPGALMEVEEILPYMERGEFSGADEPGHIYLTCYQVLKATNDPRAGDILNQGYDSLQSVAAKLTDESMRGSFLGNVSYNRDLIAAWHTEQSGSGA